MGFLDGRAAIMTGAAKGVGRGHAPEAAESYGAMVEGTLLGRMGDCELDVGRPVAGLCAPDAGYLTGSVVALDGGGAFVY